MDSLNDKIFFEALLVDEATPNVIYRGFSMPGSLASNPLWAIEKTTLIGEITKKQWAGGNRNLDKIWDNRENLQYS